MTPLLEILNNLGIQIIKTNNPAEITVQCNSGLHADNKPSMMINLEKAVCHCFVCGFGGSVHRFLENAGYSVDIDLKSKKEFKARRILEKINLLRNKNRVTMPINHIPVERALFKGIAGTILNSFNAFKTTEYKLEGYICFPIVQNGVLRFIDARRENSDDPPKYIRWPATVKTSDVLYPIDRVKDKSKVILVEGIFDMLNLWQHGFTNTLCIFGTSNFSSEKAKMLDNFGCLHADIMMDGDNAGDIASQRIKGILDKLDISTSIIRLPPGKDPGELSKGELETLLCK